MSNTKLRFLLFCVLILAGILLAFLILSNIPDKESGLNGVFAVDNVTNEGQIIFSIPYDQPTSITFGDNVGRLSWEDGKMSFEGDTHESAKLFFEYLKGYIDSYIDSELKSESGLEFRQWDLYNIPCTQYNSEELYTYPESEIPEETLLEFTTGGVLKDDFKPVNFIKVTDVDISKCFINDRLRISLNGKRYWLRLEEDVNVR